MSSQQDFKKKFVRMRNDFSRNVIQGDERSAVKFTVN